MLVLVLVSWWAHQTLKVEEFSAILFLAFSFPFSCTFTFFQRQHATSLSLFTFARVHAKWVLLLCGKERKEKAKKER